MGRMIAFAAIGSPFPVSTDAGDNNSLTVLALLSYNQNKPNLISQP
jgi:hypothetical protein